MSDDKTSVGNSDALRAHKEASQRQTRKDLELALARLRNGNPRFVKRDVAITASSVAAEANVDRSTLYRYHKPILDDIRRLNDATTKKILKDKRVELSQASAKTGEYRAALDAAVEEIVSWARQNYALTQRIQELDEMIVQRDNIIKELQTKLNDTHKITSLSATAKRGCSEL